MYDSSIFLKKDAKQAGLLYLLHMAAVIYGVFFISFILGISGTDGMADSIISNERLFRTGIASRILGALAMLFLSLKLYRLLKDINIPYAQLMLALALLSVPFQFFAELFNITSLMLAKGELMKSIDSPQRHELSNLFLNLYNNTVSVGQLFWGLWLLPFGLLAQKYMLLPRVLCRLLVAGSVCYLVDYIAFLFSPGYRSFTVLALFFGFACELYLMLFLLFIGWKNKAS